MRITRIKITNYRSIKSIELHPSEFNVIIGQNNHGKTNVFEAIEWFYKAKSSEAEEHFGKDEKRVIAVEIDYSGAQKSAQGIPDEVHRTKITGLLGESDEITVRKTSDNHKRTYVINGKEHKNPSGFDTAVNAFLPKLEYVHTKVKLEDYSQYGRNPIGTMLSEVLSAIVGSDPQYKKFSGEFEKVFGDSEKSKVRVALDELGKSIELYLEKQFPDGAKVQFSVMPPELEDLLKNFASEVDDGIPTDIQSKGDGMQRALMLAVIQAYSDYRKKDESARDFLFLINEAELHLHPSAQRSLKKALLDVTERGDQVFLNTHSSVLVTDIHEAQAVYSATKRDTVTHLNKVSEKELPSIVFDLLGGSPADLLLPSNILIVEGYSEVVFIRQIIQKFYPNYSNIQIAPANGDISKQDKSIRFVDLAYELLKPDQNPYSDKVVVLVDQPHEGNQEQYDRFKAAHQELVDSGRYFELPVGSLEEYYPGDWQSTPQEVINGEGKLEYARQASASITKEEFETMSVITAALSKASQLSFGNAS